MPDWKSLTTQLHAVQLGAAPSSALELSRQAVRSSGDVVEKMRWLELRLLLPEPKPLEMRDHFYKVYIEEMKRFNLEAGVEIDLGLLFDERISRRSACMSSCTTRERMRPWRTRCKASAPLAIWGHWLCS